MTLALRCKPEGYFKVSSVTFFMSCQNFKVYILIFDLVTE